MVWKAVVDFFVAVGKAVTAYATANPIRFALEVYTLYTGVKGFLQAKQMLAKGQDILANKTAAGGKIPVIYGTRRVGAQIVYMDTAQNRSKDLFVVYALAVGECDEIIPNSIEIDGNSIYDGNIYKGGGYVGSDRYGQTGYNNHRPLNTASQVGDNQYSSAGNLGTNPALRYSFVFNLHHGASSQTVDPMLSASIGSQWTTAHKLNGICYIAASFDYDKKGMYKGVPQITVQVRGKRVFDPRDNSTKWSSNSALCFLDYIQNDEYGKGLATSQINMTAIGTAADKCDTLVDQPYYNGSYQSFTWSGDTGNDYIVINDYDDWFQNKIDEVLDIRDSDGDLVIDETDIKDSTSYEFYDQTQENRVYINDILSEDYTNEAGTIKGRTKRFHCNGYIDTNKNVMDNAKELLANMRGIFTYIDGKYELQIEDTGTSTFSITDDHIIGDAGISVDYGNKDKRANKVVIEFFNANKKYELDTATVLHDASPEYYSDDGEILEVKAEFPYVTDPYIAYNMGKAILTRSRNQTTMQFLGTPEMYKLNVGDIVDLTYLPLNFNAKICRVEALELQANGLVAVSLIEYFDVYTWEVPAQEPTTIIAKPPTIGAIHPPEANSIVFTDTDASSINRPTLTWTEPTDFPVRQYRVDVEDTANPPVQVFSKLVDTNSVDLSFLAVGNYNANITSFNGVGIESNAVVKSFTIGNPPTATADIQDDAVVTDKITDDAITTPKILDGNVTDAKINSLTANKITAGTIDASVITVTNLDADNITSGTIGADKITVTDLAAINSNLGDIDAGSLNIGSSAFVVTTAGAMTATSANVTGSITATSLNVQNATVTGTLDASVITVNGEVLSTLVAYGTTAGQDGNFFKINNQLDLEGKFYWNAGGNTNYFYLGNGDEDDVSLYITSSASNAIVLGDESNALGSFKIRYGNDINASYNDSFIELDGDWTTGHVSTGTPETTYTISGETTITNSTVGIKAKTTTPLKLYFSSDANQNDLSRVELSKTTIAGSATTPIVEVTQGSAPSTTTNKLYNVGGSLYWNGAVVDTGAGDITGVTINTSGGSLTGGASFASGDATFTLDIGTTVRGSKTFEDDVTFESNVVIEGNLDVQGTTTTIDTANLDVKDKNITLNYGTGDTSANANGAGITIQDAVSATQDATLTWNTANDSFNFSHPLNVTGGINSGAIDATGSISTTGSITSTNGTVDLYDNAGNKPKIKFREDNNDAFILEYNGDGSGTGNYVAFYSNVTGWVAKGSGFNYVPANGRVGIGLSNPSEKLSVAGNISATGTVSASSLGVTNIVTNKVVKFNGSILDDSNITDTGSAITLGSNTTVTGTIDSGSIESTGVITANDNIKIVGATGSSGFMYIFDRDNGTATSDGFLLQKSGNGAFVYNRESSGNLSLGAGDTNNYFIITSTGAYLTGTAQWFDQARNLSNIASYNGYTPTKSSDSTNSVISLDSRNVNSSPSARNKGLYVDFKLQTTIGLTGSGSYAGVLTFRSYGSSTDLSGGYPIQIAYDQAGNLQTRYGSSSSAWGSWKAIHLAGNDLSAGNITVTGTVDGRDIADDGNKLDGIEANATTDQTQAEINALGITAIGLSGTPNITVGTINSGAIDVTGTVTSDGLTVEASSPMLTLSDTDGTNQLGRIYQSGSNLIINCRDNTSNGGISIVASNGSITTNRLTISSLGTFNLHGNSLTNVDTLSVDGTQRWYQSDTDRSHQRADARQEGGTNQFARLHWYGVKHDQSTSNFRHAWYDGNSYVNVTAENNGITFGGAITSSGAVYATEYDLPSGGMLDWANGDARIIEGLVNNYSLSFQTYDGSNVTTALRLDGNNTATFAGTIDSGAITSTGNATFNSNQFKIQHASPTLILKDTSDDDDHGILFKDSNDATLFAIQTQNADSADSFTFYSSSDAIVNRIGTTNRFVVTGNGVSITGDATISGLLELSGGLSADQSGQTISGFSTIRVGHALIGQDVATLTTTSASQTNRILASATTYRTIKVLVQIKSSTNFHATEILLTHNGTTVYMTEYATIFSNSSLATFDADISGGNIRLLVDPNQSASTEFKFSVSGIET